MKTIFKKVAIKDRKPEIGQKVIGISYGPQKETSTVSLGESGYWYSHEWSSECDEPEFWLEEINEESLLKQNAELREMLEEVSINIDWSYDNWKSDDGKIIEQKITELLTKYPKS